MTGTPERLVVQTTDFDETVATMRAAFGDIELRRDEEVAVRFSLRSLHSPDLTAVRWSMDATGGGNRDEDADTSESILTGVRVDGGLRMWSRWDDIDTDRPFLYPDRVDSALDHPDISHLAVARSVLDARARAMTGIDDLTLRFIGTAPASPGLDILWRDTMVSASRTLDSLAELPDLELAQTGLVDMVASIMLRVFPNTAVDAMKRVESVRSVTPVLRRAVHFVDDNLDRPITVTDIADAARLSTRGLFAAFRRDLDTTPMEYLRSARVAAAHHELLAADPGVATVTDVALRWGFTNAGRFAERYRAAFGESPTDTLRR